MKKKLYTIFLELTIGIKQQINIIFLYLINYKSPMIDQL